MKRFGICAALSLMMMAIGHSVRAAAATTGVNPLFVAWEKFEVGSSETLEGTIESAAGPMTSSTTTKLLEKADDHVVVEAATTVTIGGTPRTLPGKKTTIAKDADEAKKMKVLGTEDVTVAGKTYKCKIYTQAEPNAQAQTSAKIWASTEVPGGVVKIEITGKVKVVQTLKSFEAK